MGRASTPAAGLQTRPFSQYIHSGLRGRVALVTGANQGIGAAAAGALAAEGAHVFLTYLRVDRAGHGDPALPQSYDEARARPAEAVVEAIRQAGGRADAWEADLADPAVVPHCSTGRRRPSCRIARSASDGA